MTAPPPASTSASASASASTPSPSASASHPLHLDARASSSSSSPLSPTAFPSHFNLHSSSSSTYNPCPHSSPHHPSPLHLTHTHTPPHSLSNPPIRPDALASLTRDLAALALKSPSKRRPNPKARAKTKKKRPEFRYRVGLGALGTGPDIRYRVGASPFAPFAPAFASRPHSPAGKRLYKAKNKKAARTEPRSRRHAMLRRHRVPSPTPTV